MSNEVPFKFFLLNPSVNRINLDKLYNSYIKNSDYSFGLGVSYSLSNSPNCLDILLFKDELSWPPISSCLMFFDNLNQVNNESVVVKVDSLRVFNDEFNKMRYCNNLSDYVNEFFHNSSDSVVYGVKSATFFDFSSTLESINYKNCFGKKRSFQKR